MPWYFWAGIILAVFAFIFLVYLFLVFPGKKKEMEKYKNVKYAHRGLHNEERAENTLSAFRSAVEMGYGIELDVRLSSDGELVVFHDDDLKRAANIDKRVDSLTAKELSELKLFGLDEGVPTLKEVLELVDGKIPLLVEIKEDKGNRRVSDKTAQVLKDYKGPLLIESFNPMSLARIKKQMPNTLRGLLSERFFKDKRFRKPMYFVLEHLLFNVVCRPAFIAYYHTDYKNNSFKLCRALGAGTVAWTVNSKEEEEAALKNGFTSVIFEDYLA